MTSQERAYEVARKWMPDSAPDSMRVIALMCHIQLAIDAAVAESRPVGDLLGQAESWTMVFRLCVELGMDLSSDATGADCVLNFIRERCGR